MSIPIETTELCSYGCGQIAKYKFGNGKLCCSDNINKCSINRKKISNSHKSIQLKTTELCSYGCGQVAKYKLKNGKLCCREHYAKCPINSKKISNGHKLTPIETTELCSYGCGQIAKYELKNGKLCCSNYLNKCPINRKKNSIGHKSIQIKTTELCSYGCGQIAKYELKNGKLCCSDSINKCPINSKNISDNKNAISIETIELCSYGCGQVAKYQFKNGKLCCRDHYTKCSINNRKIKENKKLTPIITTELCSYGCGQVAKYKLKNGKLCCSEYLSKCPENRKNKKLTINKIKEIYPTFYKEEELRYNPAKSNEIQVRCKYNKCKNSKENNGWFTPSSSQIHERIRHLEKPWGNDGGYFYCSNECKEKCDLFGLRSDPFKNKTQVSTYEERIIFRQEVLRRQKDEYGYNSCEMCGSKENLQVHHEKPQKTHPGMTLDPDNGIILCKKCHYKIGHKKGTECSTGNLANYTPCN